MRKIDYEMDVCTRNELEKRVSNETHSEMGSKTLETKYLPVTLENNVG